MPKLQRIMRSNGSFVYSVNIPLEIIEVLGWDKGIELSVETQKVRVSSGILVFKTEEEEESNDS
jgi:hypothetical protein